MSVENWLSDNFRHYLNVWRSSKGEGDVPALATLLDAPDPLIHPWLNIVDVEAPDIQLVRLAGTAVVNYFGKDLTRTNFLDILSPQALPIILRAHHHVSSVPCGVFHEAIAVTSLGREFDLLALALPFKRSNGLPCVAWRLEPAKVLSYDEACLQVKSVTRWNWIDLGKGVPA